MTTDPNGRLLAHLSRLRERPEVVTWYLPPVDGARGLLGMASGTGAVEIHDPAKATRERRFFPLFWLADKLNQRQMAAAALAAVEVARSAFPESWGLSRLPWAKDHYDTSVLALPVDKAREVYRSTRLVRELERAARGDGPVPRILYAWETALGVASGDGEMPDNWLGPVQDSQMAMVLLDAMSEQQFGWAWLDRFEFLLRGHKADPTIGRMRPREEDPELKPLVAPARSLHRELADYMGEEAVISVAATRSGDGQPVIAVVWRDKPLAQDGQDNLTEWKGWPVVHIAGQGRPMALTTSGLSPAQEQAVIENNLAKPAGKRFVREMQELLGKTPEEARRALLNVRAWIPVLETARQSGARKRRATLVGAEIASGTWRPWGSVQLPPDVPQDDRERVVKAAVGQHVRDARGWKRTPPIAVVGRLDTTDGTRSLTELVLRVGPGTFRVRFPTWRSYVDAAERIVVEHLEVPGTD